MLSTLYILLLWKVAHEGELGAADRVAEVEAAVAVKTLSRSEKKRSMPRFASALMASTSPR